MTVRSASIPVLVSVLTALGATTADAARGGPDAGGWTWADSRETGVSPTVEVPATSRSIVVPPAVDEGIYPVDLSFPFTLYGVTSSRIWVSTNGWFSMRDPGLAAVPVDVAIPTPGIPDAVGAWAWDDASLGLLSIGSNSRGDVLQISYFHKGLSTWMQGHIEFLRAGAVVFYYKAPPPTATITIGIEDGSGSIGTQLVHDGTLAPGISFTTPYALMFYPPSPLDCTPAIDLLCPTPVTGSTLGGPAVVNNYGCDAVTQSGAERVYRVEQQRPGRFQASLSGLGGRDANLYLLSDACHPGFGCLSGGGTSIDIPSLQPGTYFVVVDGTSAGDDGDFTLTVTTHDADCNRNGIGDSCDLFTGASNDCNADGRPDECGNCPVDVVFAMDTSGSMNPYFPALCAAITDTIAQLSLESIDFTAQAWGITDNGSSCLTDNVSNQLGRTVPGSPAPPLDTLTDSESWGQATSIVAGLYPWSPDAVRVVVPIGDEGPYLGTPVNDPGNDRDVITHAISVCVANGVIASPITPDISNPGNILLAQDLAAGTGGTWSSTGTNMAEAILALVRDACSLFAAAAVAGPDVDVCGPTTITLDGSASSPTCIGGVEYRWLEGATEVCGTWSTTPTCEVTPTATTTYTLEVRCVTDPGCIIADSMQVNFTPGPVPPSIGNTLLSTHRGLDVTMVWGAVADAVSYNLDRGTDKRVWPPVFMTGLAATVTVADVPSPPSLYFYRVTGVNCAGLDGP